MRGRWVITLMAGALVLGSLSIANAAPEKTDDEIVNTTKDSYVYKNYLKDDNITVEARNGEVTLTGEVKEESHKSLAEETAAATPGVIKVNNQLKVTNTQDATNKDTDGWIGLKAKSSLLFHRNVSGTATRVDVKDGVVILSGNVESQAQKDLATQYIRDVEGVKSVDNQLNVVPADAQPKDTFREDIDDASISAQVKLALLYNRSTSGLRTKVSAENGVVVLSGKAKNAAEKDLATEITKDIRGVKNVINNMTIDTKS